MDITPQLSDQAVLAELGARLERTRLERNLSQQELASSSGVARNVVQRLESGAAVTTTNFVRVLRGLGLTAGLDQLVPEPLPSPVQLLQLHGRTRRRASGRKRKRTDSASEAAAWRWGDERPTTDE
jgi:transcriptional regulator with XRE-family HTH domain